MTAQLYLITPPDAGSEAFSEMLKPVLAAVEVGALLLTRGTRSEAGYRDFVGVIAPIVQAAGTAALIEGTPALVLALSVDGLHVDAATGDLDTALAQLKPDLIVGLGAVSTRHDAMTLGELGPDYIMFGPLSGAIAPETRELAGWWAEAMVIPSVLSDPQATVETADAMGSDFLALGESLWSSPDPVAMIAAIAEILEQPA